MNKRPPVRDRLWLWWHGRHGELVSWGVPLDQRPYWTCSCGSTHPATADKGEHAPNEEGS